MFSFQDLVDSVGLEDIGQGRRGVILVDDSNAFVRTTAVFQKPMQPFVPIHYVISTGLQMNNALMEVYESSYKHMKYHSDQSLDLVVGSTIAIYSYYEDPIDIRSLKLKHKTTGVVTEHPLVHNTIFLLSFDMNQQYVHKLTNNHHSKWLGLTFRLSKNFARPRQATEQERLDFLKYKGEENKIIGYCYPTLDYTLSPGDLVSNNPLHSN